jgi:excisionase family DNA binding protein
MSVCNTGIGELGPLVVKPKVAWKMLGCSNTRGYELIAAGELESFRDGRSRKITVESIHRLIARRLAAEKASAAAPQFPRRPGRRKSKAAEGAS